MLTDFPTELSSTDIRSCESFSSEYGCFGEYAVLLISSKGCHCGTDSTESVSFSCRSHSKEKGGVVYDRGTGSHKTESGTDARQSAQTTALKVYS